VVVGIWGYYRLSEAALILRILAVAGGILAAAAVAWWSEPGRQFAVFAGESLDEVKKVVWPTRKETMQTTAAVFAFVVVMAVFLWLTDKTLEWALYDLILGWKKT
jgi:preprotein translocase subunit SecE